MPSPKSNHDWNEYRVHVLKSLDDIPRQIESLSNKLDQSTNSLYARIETIRTEINGKVDDLRTDIAVLKTKERAKATLQASIWGGIVGLIVSVTTWLIKKP
jgi:conjugal transfer/entry exclusion protein